MNSVLKAAVAAVVIAGGVYLGAYLVLKYNPQLQAS